MSLRFRIYRSLAAFAFWIFRKKTGLPLALVANPLSDPVIWFHAASAGELESLWPVVQEVLQESNAVLSIFSPSASKGAQRLLTESMGKQGKLVVVESPSEGGWAEVLNRFRPRSFVTAKYEAWPDLWRSVAQAGIPLIVVGAKWRPSFEGIQKLSKKLKFELPDLRWVCDEEADLKKMLLEFTNSQGMVDADPRWDRVAERLRTGNPRAREVLEGLGTDVSWAPKPWGILGSAWSSDLQVILPALEDTQFAGTLWVVPHHVKGAEFDKILGQIQARSLPFARSSKPSVRQSQKNAQYTVNLVDEMGVLNELYSKMDWVYVGGGFEKGVHSTIEPALSLKPLSSGLARADRFPEIAFLKSTGQLTQVAGTEDFVAWLRQRNGGASETSRQAWETAIQKKRGSAQRIAKWILGQA